MANGENNQYTEDDYNTWLELQAQYLEEEGEEDEWGDEEDW